MALSFNSVQKAYEVFHELKKVTTLTTPSWPQDMSSWGNSEKENPPLNVVLGWDQKYDNGWENLFFFVKNPSTELIALFERLKKCVPNSSMAKPYKENNDLWIFGWF